MGFDKKYFSPKTIGIIGCGNRGSNLIKNIQELDVNVTLTALLDVEPERALSRLRESGVDISHVRIWDDADKMLDQSGIDGVIIASRSDSHVFFAKKALERGIPLLLEKPITFSMQELIELRDLYEVSEKKVLISFPLRTSPIIALVKEILDSGRIGTPEHIQAFNYVPYGGVYFHSWYSQVGLPGLFFEKTTHDFDWINYLAGEKPTELAVMVSQQIFGGNERIGKKCCDCERMLTCMESPFLQKNFIYDNPHGTDCAFAETVSTYDSAGILIRYESGMHANYAENHFVRKGAGARGARISGYSGTLDFDWYTNTVRVTRHHQPIAETHKFDDASGHFGGDRGLIFDFVKLLHGISDSTATLENGFVSTLMCMAARKSLEEKSYAPIVWGDGHEL